jgi:hypothetical protein
VEERRKHLARIPHVLVRPEITEKVLCKLEGSWELVVELMTDLEPDQAARYLPLVEARYLSFQVGFSG